MSESGELSESEGDIDSDASYEGSEEENTRNVSGLFDALAAAQEAGERYKMLEEGVTNESCRLPENFLVKSFREAINLTISDVNSGVLTDDNVDINWKVGDRCNAMYVEDGEYYKAKVLIVKKWKNTAVVQFTEYGNEEEVDMAKMMKLEHRPSKKRKKRPIKKKRKRRSRNKTDTLLT